MASNSARYDFTFVAAALSSLTDKKIVTKKEYDCICYDIQRGENKEYVCVGEINVVKEVSQSYLKTAELVERSYSHLTDERVPMEDAQRNRTASGTLQTVMNFLKGILSISTETEMNTNNCAREMTNLEGTRKSQDSPMTSTLEDDIANPDLGIINNRDCNNEENNENTISVNDSSLDELLLITQNELMMIETVNLTVTLPSGEDIVVEVESANAFISDIKDQIQEKSQIAKSEQVLHFGGQQLNGDRLLCDYNITTNSTLKLTINAEGRKKTELFYINDTYLDPAWDYDFTNMTDDGNKYMRGGHQYHRPYGWKRIALKVLGKYENDTWLGKSGTRTEESEGEWAVTYHGTEHAAFNNISNEGYRRSKRHGAAYGTGIYSSPYISEARLFASTFEYEGNTYLGIFQNRANPNGVQLFLNGKYWLCAKEADIRPYGLCVKRITSNQ